MEAGKGKGKGKGKGGGGRGGGGRGGGSAPPKRSLTSRLTFKVSRKKPDGTPTAVADAAPAATKAGADAQSEPSSPASRGGRGRGSSAAPPAAKEKTTPPILKQISISFPRGQLTMVAGAVGSGKVFGLGLRLGLGLP